MSKKNSISSNSSDKEIDFLEEEFLKCTPDDLPVPKEEIKIYNDEVLEVMKTGCNRQIAEYVMIKYKNLEDEEGKDKLVDLKTKYVETKIKFFEKVNSIFQNQDKLEKSDKLGKYEEEINEFWENNKEKNMNEIRYVINNLLEKQDKEKDKDKDKNKDEEAKQFYEAKEKYYRKRDAVIEAALRKVKKIVNDKEEYKKFFKEYYGKDYVEDEEINENKNKK